MDVAHEPEVPRDGTAGGLAAGVVPPGQQEGPKPKLHAYEQQIVNDLVEEDGLVILGAGLGLQRLLAVLLRLHYHSREGVLLVLGMAPWLRECVREELRRHDPLATPPVDVNNEVPATERLALYRSPGACLAITPRILVVDMLTRRVTPQQIAGMIILNAHRVTDSSGEAFAVRLYRSGNTRGYVRAFSDVPVAFSGGFNKVEKIMRALYVRKLHLWPRFRDELACVLELGRPEVVEWEQELPKSMLMIQAAVQEVMEALIKDLKRTHKVDCAGLSVTSRSLAESLRRQLEPVWNSLSWRTRQIIKDLRSLREVLEHLVHCDAITFLAYLESLRLSAGHQSVWLFHDAAHTIFEQARRRVYLYRSAGPGAATVSVQQPDSAQAAAAGSRSPAKVSRKRKATPPPAANDPSNPVAETAPTARTARARGANTAAGAGATGRGKDLPGGSGQGATGPGGVEAVLEQVPKWSLLRQVLSEAQARRRALHDAQPGQPDPLYKPPPATADEQPGELPNPAAHTGPQPSPEVIVLSDSSEDEATDHRQPNGLHSAEKPTSGPDPVVPVLDAVAAEHCQHVGRACVMVVSRELHSCGQLEEVLRHGGQAVMQAAYEAYLLRQEQAKQQTKNGRRPRASRGRGGGGSGLDDDADGRGWRGRGRRGGSGRAGGGSGVGLGPAVLHPGEASALEEEGQRLLALRQQSSGGVAGTGTGFQKKKRSKTGGKQQTEQQQQRPGQDVSATDLCSLEDTVRPAGARSRQKHSSRQTDAGDASTVAPLQQPQGDSAVSAAREECPALAGVHFCALDAHCEDQLWQLKPGTVIMYEPDLAFLRQVEVYSAAHPELRVQVHILTYCDSTEQELFLNAVDREVTVFTSLIEFKQHIVLPAGPPPVVPNQLLPRGAAALEADAWLDVYQQNAITRLGGQRGLGNKPAPRRLVVDVREFMSSLPCVLYQQGFELVPVTLEVGDYVLSPTLCVERKAVPDLISSLASGRLYSQAEAMCKHYKTPVLLIEFDPNKPFGLQSVHELGEDIESRAVGSRLVLLLLHFPRLRLVWSRSLHATADMFASLKSNMDEPDPATAQAVGLPAELASAGVSSGSDSAINVTALELLKRLPGVTEANARLIMASVNNLAELATTPVERLEVIMHSQRNAKLLHDFLHAPCPKP